MPGKLYIIAAPSGAGKSSLVRALVERLPNTVASISHTTRAPRQGEVEGQHYYFVSQETFKTMIAEGAFLEYATVFARIANNYYGTHKQWVEEQLADGKNVILEIDWQGARQVFSKMPTAVGIFILPPRLATLEERLNKRAQDDPARIKERMSVAQDEISHFEEYDYLIVNEDFETACQEIMHIMATHPPLPHWQESPQAERLQRLVSELLAGYE